MNTCKMWTTTTITTTSSKSQATTHAPQLGKTTKSNKLHITTMKKQGPMTK
jgi:hypothetical protein